MLWLDKAQTTEGRNPTTSRWSTATVFDALNSLKAKFPKSKPTQPTTLPRKQLEEVSAPHTTSNIDPLQTLAEYPQTTTPLSTALERINQDQEKAFSESGLVARILGKTLKANLEGFPQSAETLQASLLTIYHKLQNKSPGLISSIEIENLAEIKAQLSIDAYLAETKRITNKDTAPEIPDIYKIAKAEKQRIKKEELKALEALLTILQESNTQNKLGHARLLKPHFNFRSNTEHIPNGINTFNELRQSLTLLLGKQIIASYSAESAAVGEKPAQHAKTENPSPTIRSARIGIEKALAYMVSLEKEFFKKIVSPHYEDLLRKLESSPNQQQVLQELRSAMKAMPASLGKVFLLEHLTHSHLSHEAA